MSEIQIFNCAQGEADWFECRKGIATASKFKDVLAKGEGKTRTKYMRVLAGEILTGTPHESYSNAAMERGKEQEPDARKLYEMIHDVEVVEVGFIRRGDIGCSPDGLIGEDGGFEVKSKAADIQIEILESGAMPSEHVAQVQGSLLVSGRQWWDFMTYCPGLPPFFKRCYPEPDYQARLIVELRQFNTELNALVERIRGMF
jgi:hypothetical protein